MLYHLSDICRGVRLLLHENLRTEALIDAADIDTLMLDDLIAGQVERAASEVLLAAPHALLEEGLPFCADVVWHRHPCHQWGHVLLPDDYLRLVTFRMSDWDRAATLITPDDVRYQWQQSRYPGICGNPQNPIVAEVTYAEGRVLEFYSCRLHPCPHVLHARYIPIPRLHPADRTIHLPRRLFDPLVSQIAKTLNFEH